MATKGLTSEELLALFDTPIKKVDGIYQYAEFHQAAHSIIIKFDKIFKRKDIKQHNIFKIPQKRYYSEGNATTKAMLPTICSDLNYVFNQDNDSIRAYASFSMKIALKEKKPYPEEKFIEEMQEFINLIKPYIDQYIEENYELKLTEVNEKINTDLQVTDEMNKVFIKSAIAMRIVIPIICEYTIADKNSILFYQIFKKIMNKFSEDGYNAIPKLMSIIRSRVEQTKYANKKIWKLLLSHTKDVKTLCEEFKASLIETIIPKLDINRSSIKYIDVVLRNKLDFTFTYNFPCDYRPLRNLENDDDTDERDRLNETIFTNKKDEASLILNKLTIERHISQFLIDNSITIDDIKNFKKVYLLDKPLNNIQKYFLFLSYGKEFEVSITNEFERTILLYELIQDLEDLGFHELPTVLASTVENEVEIRNKVSGKKIRDLRKFEKIIKKYNDVEDIIEKDNFIIKIISFRNYTYYDENKETRTINPSIFELECLNYLMSL